MSWFIVEMLINLLHPDPNSDRWGERWRMAGGWLDGTVAYSHVQHVGLVLPRANVAF